jgi:hypothetical protein
MVYFLGSTQKTLEISEGYQLLYVGCYSLYLYLFAARNGAFRKLLLLK